jgi:uridine kinase
LKTHIIAISGPSGAGKTTIANALRQELLLQSPASRVALIREDDYYRDQSHLSFEQRLHTNYDHPAALEHSLLRAHLLTLQRGEAVEIPTYDYTRHTRSGRTHTQAPVDVLILEGILLFSNAELLQLFDLRVFVHTPLEQCLQRRIARDTTERGRTRGDVETQFEACVVPMYHDYLHIWQEQADLVIDGQCQPEAALELVLHKLGSHAERR